MVKVWWEEREDETRDTYHDLDDAQFTMLVQAVAESNEAMQIVAHSQHAADAPDLSRKGA